MDKMTWQEFQQWQRWDEFPERADNPPLTVDAFFLSEGKGYGNVLIVCLYSCEISKLKNCIK